MKAVSYRLDDDVLTLIDALRAGGFGNSATDVVRRAVVYASRVKPGEWADAWAEWLDSASERAPVAAVVAVTAVPTEPACEICGEPMAQGNSRFCEAHIPPMED